MWAELCGEVQGRMVPSHKAARQPMPTADSHAETPAVKTLPEFMKWTQLGLRVSSLSLRLKHRLLLKLSKTLPWLCTRKAVRRQFPGIRKPSACPHPQFNSISQHSCRQLQDGGGRRRMGAGAKVAAAGT